MESSSGRTERRFGSARPGPRSHRLPSLVIQLLLNLKREGQREGGGCCFIPVPVLFPPDPLTLLSSAICSTLENVMKRVPSLRRLMQTTLISCCSFQSETKVSEKKKQKKEGFSPRIKLGVCPLHLSDSACKSISRFPCFLKKKEKKTKSWLGLFLNVSGRSVRTLLSNYQTLQLNMQQIVVVLRNRTNGKFRSASVRIKGPRESGGLTFVIYLV